MTMRTRESNSATRRRRVHRQYKDYGTKTKGIKSHSIRVYNKSRQTISLQLTPKGGDFFLHQQQVHIRPGIPVEIPKSHIIEEQIQNLQKQGMISVLFDSEKHEENNAD